MLLPPVAPVSNAVLPSYPPAVLVNSLTFNPLYRVAMIDGNVSDVELAGLFTMFVNSPAPSGLKRIGFFESASLYFETVELVQQYVRYLCRVFAAYKTLHNVPVQDGMMVLYLLPVWFRRINLCTFSDVCVHLWHVRCINAYFGRSGQAMPAADDLRRMRQLSQLTQNVYMHMIIGVSEAQGTMKSGQSQLLLDALHRSDQQSLSPETVANAIPKAAMFASVAQEIQKLAPSEVRLHLVHVRVWPAASADINFAVRANTPPDSLVWGAVSLLWRVNVASASNQLSWLASIAQQWRDKFEIRQLVEAEANNAIANAS